MKSLDFVKYKVIPNGVKEYGVLDDLVTLCLLRVRAATSKARLEIFDFIKANEGTIVSNIYQSLKMEQSIVSQHLRILLSVGFVRKEQRGSNVCYFTTPIFDKFCYDFAQFCKRQEK